MQTRCEEFRAHAAECQALADYYGEFIKSQYQQLACQWLFLAERATASDARLRWAGAWKEIRDAQADHRRSRLAPRRLSIIRI
jgi:hypothetical protein